LLLDATHDGPSGDFQQDVIDQSQLLIVKAPELSSTENLTAQIRAMPSAAEVNLLTYFIF
jgi:hypothetical protein